MTFPIDLDFAATVCTPEALKNGVQTPAAAPWSAGLLTAAALAFYREDAAFRAAVDERRRPKRLPRDLALTIAAQLRTAVSDLLNGNMSVLEDKIIRAYDADQPSTTGRTDKLDALHDDRLAVVDHLGAFIVDEARCAKAEPPRSVGQRAIEMLGDANLVTVSEVGRPSVFLATCYSSDETHITFSCPGLSPPWPGFTIRDDSEGCERGGQFYFEERIFTPWYR